MFRVWEDWRDHDYGYLRGAAQEDVKKVLDVSLKFAIVDIGGRGGYFGDQIFW